MKIPRDIIDHCAKHRLCKGCPLKTCDAPTHSAGDPRWDQWLTQRIAEIRRLYA